MGDFPRPRRRGHRLLAASVVPPTRTVRPRVLVRGGPVSPVHLPATCPPYRTPGPARGRRALKARVIQRLETALARRGRGQGTSSRAPISRIALDERPAMSRTSAAARG